MEKIKLEKNPQNKYMYTTWPIQSGAHVLSQPSPAHCGHEAFSMSFSLEKSRAKSLTWKTFWLLWLAICCSSELLIPLPIPIAITLTFWALKKTYIELEIWLFFYRYLAIIKRSGYWWIMPERKSRLSFTDIHWACSG